VIGGVGVGLYPDFSMADRMNAIAETMQPQRQYRTLYDKASIIFEKAYTGLEAVFELMGE
jgi:hypothetical protein